MECIVRDNAALTWSMHSKLIIKYCVPGILVKIDKQLRLRCIACEISYRELCLLVARSRNIVDLDFLPKGLHDIETEDMLKRLQEKVDEASSSEVGYDYIIMAYGLCNNGTVGLTARKIPIVMPMAHDCITFFLGSKERYREYFDSHPGTYFKTTGWTERNFAAVDGKIMAKLGLDKSYEEYVKQHGEENAKFIMETMGKWVDNYKRLTFIEMAIAQFLGYDKLSEQEAKEKSWAFEKIAGDMSLLRKLVEGEWDEDRFIMLKPGQKVTATGDEDIIKAV